MTTNLGSEAGNAAFGDVQWENAVATIPHSDNVLQYLDKAGEEGWRPWGVIMADQKAIHIGLTRPKKMVRLATPDEMKLGLLRLDK